MLREQREELWILAERNNYRGEAGLEPCIGEPKRARLLSTCHAGVWQ